MVEKSYTNKLYALIILAGVLGPSGKLVPEVIERRLRTFAPRAEIYFKRLLVNPEQIAEWNLPTKPAKKNNSHAKNFKGGTVEAEAIPARRTRRIVRERIEQHLDDNEVLVMRAAEESEADYLINLADVLAEEGRANV